MSVTRSEEYYFPRDNLVIQVEDTLFRLSSSNLELHSGLFRDMFATPSNDDQEGASDEHPLRLPPDLCSAETFTTICKIICPKVAAVFPPVLVKEFGKWEPVLKATDALQMIGVQNYILARLQDDKDAIKTEPTRLLSWAVRSELPLETLKLECFYALAYRRRPLSAPEIDAIGSKATALVICARERIRLLFAKGALGYSMSSGSCNCGRAANCRFKLLDALLSNLSDGRPSSDSEPEQDNSDIFRVVPEGVSNVGVCRRLTSQFSLDEILASLRGAKLDQVVGQCVLGEWL